MKVGKQEKEKPTAAKAKETLKTPSKAKEKNDKETPALPKHEQKGKHSQEEAAGGPKRKLGKKQIQSS